jgi:flagellin-like protein
MPSLRRAGVSEVVASLLLLLIVLSLSVLVFLYGVGALRLSQSILSYEFFTERRTLRERLTIVDVWFHDGVASVAVFNHGPTPVRVVGLYVNDTPLKVEEPVEVEAGCLSWVNASLSYQLGAVYRVKVTTELGGEAVAEARAPLGVDKRLRVPPCIL